MRAVGADARDRERHGFLALPVVEELPTAEITRMAIGRGFGVIGVGALALTMGADVVARVALRSLGSEQDLEAPVRFELDLRSSRAMPVRVLTPGRSSARLARVARDAAVAQPRRSGTGAP